MTRIIIVAGTKGGVGTSTVTLLTAAQLAQRASGPVAVLDARGDLADMLNPDMSGGSGFPATLDAARDGDSILAAAVPAGDACPGVHVVHPPGGIMTSSTVSRLGSTLVDGGVPVVVDAGRVDGQLAGGLGEVGGQPSARVLVAANEYVSIQRAHSWRHWADAGIVLVNDPGRPLSADDFAAIVGEPAVTVPCSPAVQAFAGTGILQPMSPALQQHVAAFAALDHMTSLAHPAEDDHVSVLD